MLYLGLSTHARLYRYPDDRMKYLYDVNVHGAFYTAREAAKHMVPRGNGSIILVSSMSANVRNITKCQKYYMTEIYQIVNVPQVGNGSIIYAKVMAEKLENAQ